MASFKDIYPESGTQPEEDNPNGESSFWDSIYWKWQENDGTTFAEGFGGEAGREAKFEPSRTQARETATILDDIDWIVQQTKFRLKGDFAVEAKKKNTNSALNKHLTSLKGFPQRPTGGSALGKLTRRFLWIADVTKFLKEYSNGDTDLFQQYLLAVGFDDEEAGAKFAEEAYYTQKGYDYFLLYCGAARDKYNGKPDKKYLKYLSRARHFIYFKTTYGHKNGQRLKPCLFAFNRELDPLGSTAMPPQTTYSLGVEGKEYSLNISSTQDLHLNIKLNKEHMDWSNLKGGTSILGDLLNSGGDVDKNDNKGNDNSNDKGSGSSFVSGNNSNQNGGAQGNNSGSGVPTPKAKTILENIQLMGKKVIAFTLANPLKAGAIAVVPLGIVIYFAFPKVKNIFSKKRKSKSF